MAWHETNKQLPEPYLSQFTMYVALGLNALDNLMGSFQNINNYIRMLPMSSKASSLPRGRL